MMTRWMLAACFWMSGLAIISAQTIEVVPDHVPVDESAAIRTTGLQPNAHIAIRGALVDGAGHSWTSEAEFTATNDGVVDTSKQAPDKGSYKEVSSMGLVWSMKPSGKDAEVYVHPRDFGPQNITFQLLQNGRAIASAQLEQRGVARSVQKIKVEGQLHGVLFEPGDGGRHPDVLVVGGSEGGVPVEKAAWLASHGYAALALAYFRYEDLPRNLEAIPLEYFGGAIQWMAQRPEILPDQIAVVGTSRGGELALQLGSMFPQIKAVVAYVPASVRYAACCGGRNLPAAWTWGGQALTYSTMRFRDSAEMDMRAAIPVERIHGPILLISGQDDDVWPSSTMSNAVAGRLKQNRFQFAVEHLDYPHAGHRAGRPEIIPVWYGRVVNPASGRDENFGGSTEGDAQSSLDAIPKVLAFLCQNFQDCPSKN